MDLYKDFKKEIVYADKIVAAKKPSAPEKDDDLLWLDFYLCHEGANQNGHYFKRDVLEEYYVTAQRKQINWQHGQPVIGFIEKASLEKDEDAGKLAIRCNGFVWQYLYPGYAEKIVRGYENGTYRISMEVWYRNYEYLVGEEGDFDVYTSEEGKRMGLDQYVGRTWKGKNVYLAFNPPILFGGAGVVDNPADPDAYILAVAEDEKVAAIKQYHDLLHKLYEAEDYSLLSEAEIIEEHQRLHDLFGELLIPERG